MILLHSDCPELSAACASGKVFFFFLKDFIALHDLEMLRFQSVRKPHWPMHWALQFQRLLSTEPDCAESARKKKHFTSISVCGRLNMFKIRKAATGRFCTGSLVLLPTVCVWISPYNPAASHTSDLTQFLPMNSSSNSWAVNNSGQHTLSREAVASYFFLWVSKFNLKLMLSSSCQQLPAHLCYSTNKRFLWKSNWLMFFHLSPWTRQLQSSLQTSPYKATFTYVTGRSRAKAKADQLRRSLELVTTFLSHPGAGSQISFLGL